MSAADVLPALPLSLVNVLPALRPPVSAVDVLPALSVCVAHVLPALPVSDADVLPALRSPHVGSGMLADRMDLRYFLFGGMTLSAVFTALIGLAYTWNIHSLAYFICIQVRMCLYLMTLFASQSHSSFELACLPGCWGVLEQFVS